MGTKFGDFLRATRTERGLSLRELDTLTGLSYSYLAQLERGNDPRTGKEIMPTVQTMQKLASGLGIPVGELMFHAGFSDHITDETHSHVEKRDTYADEDPELEVLFRDLKELDANDRAIIMAIARERKRQREQDNKGTESIRKEDN